MLVSVLFSRTLPLIRYEITDSVALSDGDCDCGLPFSLIDGVCGRREDVVWLDGTSGTVAVQPGVFGDALERGGIAGWQVVQESGSRVRARVVAAAGFDEVQLGERLVRALEGSGAARPEVVIQRVAALEHTAVGKTPLVQALAHKG